MPIERDSVEAADDDGRDRDRRGERALRPPLRRGMTQAVIGEMGFFRRSPRSATVVAEEAVTVLKLTRANFERMRHERPELASAFSDFLMCVLADRIDFANRTVAALSR